MNEIRPGCYTDLPNEAYHHGPGTSKTGLDIINKSAEKFHHLKAVATIEREPTDAQAFGSAYHAIILEPEVFARTYCLSLRMQDVPDAVDDRDVLVSMVTKLNESRLAKLPTTGDKATLVARIIEVEAAELAAGRMQEDAVYSEAWLATLKGAELKAILEGKNESRQGLLSVSGTRHDLASLLRANGVAVTLWSDVLAEWEQNNPGRIVLSEDDWNTLHAMREKLMSHPAARALLSKKGRSEMSFYWKDKKTGELLRVRPDFYTDCGIIVDLKTARDASPEGFVSSIQSYRYDVQHPFYIDGVNAAIDQAKLDIAKARRFIFIGQEKEPPYSVGVYELDPEDVELGRHEYRNDVEKLHACREADKWPGYGDGVQRISLTEWHRKKTALAVAPTVH